MSAWENRASLRTAVAAVLLLAVGGALGIIVDRLWLSPSPMHAAPLTAEALSAQLGLSSAEEARLRLLLDSLHTEINAVVQRHPDSLGIVVRGAAQRVEEVLPSDARAEFRAWVQEHHERLMERMHGAGRHVTPAGTPP